MGNSEIAELCLCIYRKHRKALDLIYEYRPDRQATIRPLLESLIQETPGLVLDSSAKTSVYFTLGEWDTPILREGKGWTSSGRMLLFHILNDKENLKVGLVIGPGPQETRQKLFDMAQQPPFKPARKVLPNKWLIIYQRQFLTSQSYEGMSDDELAAEIRKQWANFIKSDLSTIDAVIRAQQWIWSAL